MSKKRAGAATPAIKALTIAGIPFTEHRYEHDQRAVADGLGYGEEAATAIGVDAARVFKTLMIEVGGHLAVVIVPVLHRVDLKAAAVAHGAKKATMADPAAAERSSGYVVGGISPVGQKRRLPTVVDASAMEHESVFVSGGQRGLDLELTPADLVAATQATVARITA